MATATALATSVSPRMKALAMATAIACSLLPPAARQSMVQHQLGLLRAMQQAAKLHLSGSKQHPQPGSTHNCTAMVSAVVAEGHGYERNR